MTHRVPLEQHLARPWLVHELAADFEVEDVWRFPLTLTDEHSLAEFREQMTAALETLGRFNPTRVLLALRVGMGRMLGWDRARPGQGQLLSRRHAAAEGTAPGPPPASGAQFTEVYNRPDEYLSEIENRTVQAALHLGRVPIAEGTDAVHLAVYVKPKGRLGRLYMVLIKPFRLWIVYPAILRAAKRRWEVFLQEENS